MNPQNDQPNGQVGRPLTDQGLAQANPTSPTSSPTSQQAAADIIRGQLDSIYDQTATESVPASQPSTPAQPEAETQTEPNAISQPEPQAQGHGLRTAPREETLQNTDQENQTLNYTPAESIYRRTMSTRMQQAQQNNTQWQQYHSAWQKYYQLYYERYYLSKNYLESQQKATQQPEQAEVEESISQKEAMQELRESIRQKVSQSAEKVTKSRHFVPVMAGVLVLLVFMFLQYNRVIFGTVAAYVSPGSIEPQNIIVDPSTNVDVGPDPRMIIPKINIDAPVIYGIGPDEKSQLIAMERGIAHFSIPKANAVPGQIGNAVFAAHSSNDVFATGDYKFVFAQNEKLTKGDIIYMNYESKRYTYSVTSTEVVLPHEVSKVQLDTDKPMLTLVSCVPLGTAEKRLLVFAEQVSPSPSGAKAATDDMSAPDSKAIPGKPSPTLLERLFGAS